MMNFMKGTSLIEAVVALLILSGGMVAVARLQAELISGNTLSKQRTEATNIAQDLIEEYRSFGEVSTTAGFTAYEDISSGADSFNGVNATYTRAWTVTENTNPNFKTINITVSWVGASRQNEQISVSTIVGGEDPGNISNYSSSNGSPPLTP